MRVSALSVCVGAGMLIQEKQKKGGYWELWETKFCSFLIEPSGCWSSILTQKHRLSEGKPGVLGNQS